MNNCRRSEQSVNHIHLVKELYDIFLSLPRYNHQTPPSVLPKDGIYVFFERGEKCQLNSLTVDRIVRVGTHRKDGRFRMRIRQHYGRVHSLGGNKNGSVSRKHLGGALLRRDNPHDSRLRDWLAQNGPSFAEVEEWVSRTLRENFDFTCFRVDDQKERLDIERGLIGLLSQYPLGRPSPNWLGFHAADKKIRQSGLWNTQHVDAKPLTQMEFNRLKEFAERTLRRDMSDR